MFTKRHLGVFAYPIGYGPLPFGGHVKVDQSGPRAVVAHVLHQLAEARARIGGELVAGMAQVVKVNAGKADSSKRGHPGTPIEVAVTHRRTVRSEPEDFLSVRVDRDFTALYRYCWRQSVRALREGSAARLRGALLAQAICAVGRNPDDREVMVGLAVPYYVAQQIGLVPADLFAEIAAYLPDREWAELVRWFGTQDDITLEDFAWQLVETPDGPDFVSMPRLT